MNEYIDLIVAVFAGLATCIPLAAKLIEYVTKATKEKNWPTLMKMVMDLMEEAEKQFEYGSDKKAWCLGMIEASAHTVNFQIDMEVVSAMIDQICATSKVVNAPLTVDAVAEEAADAGVC